MPEIASLFQNATEYPIPMEGMITGNIPSWLHGKFMRVGPGIFDFSETFSVNYFLDGMAILCKIEFKEDGTVILMQRILESDAYKKAMIVKKTVFPEFGTKAHPDTTKNILSRVFKTLVPTDLTDNNVGSIYSIGKDVFASSDTCFIHSIDTENLAKKNKHDLLKLCGTMLNTAHPMTDANGTTWNVGATVTSGLKYHIVKIPKQETGNGVRALEQASIIATIPSSWSTYLTFTHAFTMTENYVIFMEQPYLINCLKMAQTGIRGKSFVDCLEWHSNVKNRFYIIEKSTGYVHKTKYFTDNSYFVFHFINSYEEGNNIVIDVATYKSEKILMQMQMKTIRQNIFSNEDPAQPRRFILPIFDKSQNIKTLDENHNLVEPESFSSTSPTAQAFRKNDSIILHGQIFGDPGCELPTINPNYIGKSYKYFYATGMYYEGFYQNAICKMNVTNGETKLWKTSEPNEYCAEPIFIPRRKKVEFGEVEELDEDDGCVITCVSSGDLSKSDYVVVLDGKTFIEIGRIEFTNVKFAQTLHGIFIQG